MKHGNEDRNIGCQEICKEKIMESKWLFVDQ